MAINPSSLALRNLERAWRLELPSGQSVAHAIHIKPLEDTEILIGQGGGHCPQAATQHTFCGESIREKLRYILAEAIQFKEAVKIPVKENYDQYTEVRTSRWTRCGRNFPRTHVRGQPFASQFKSQLAARGG